MQVSQGDHMITRVIIKTIRGFDQNRKPRKKSLWRPGYPGALIPELQEDCPSRIAPDSPF